MTLTGIFLILTVILLLTLVGKLNQFENENIVLKERLNRVVGLVQLNVSKFNNPIVIQKEIKDIQKDFLEV